MEWIFDEATERFTSTCRVYDCPGRADLQPKYPPGHHFLDHAIGGSGTPGVARDKLLYGDPEALGGDEEFWCFHCHGSPMLWDQAMYRPYVLVPWTISEEP